MFSLAGSVSAATSPQTITGLVPKAAANAQPVGHLDSSQHLKLAIGLGSRDEAGLDAFISDLYNPASPNFRHYLTPEQFTEKFGPTEQDYEKLMDYAKSSGFTLTRQYSNRLVLDVDGDVAHIEKAFHITMRTYQHPTEARTFFAPDTDPTVAAGVRVLHIGGLESYGRPHPKHHRRSVNETPKVTSKEGSAPGGQLWGNDFRNAYVPGTGLDGSGQSLGLLEFEGYYNRDISDYETAIGLSGTPPQLVNVSLDGGANPGSAGENGEECTLDIEMAVAMAPGLSKIYVFEDGSSASGNGPFDDIFESMVGHTNIHQFSCSWGGDTSKDPTSEVLFKEMAAQGQTFCDASGDSDAFVGAVEFPSDSPSITQVGGTTMTDGGAPAYPYQSEVVWAPDSGPNVSSDSAEGSSGGISTYYTIPEWQASISMTGNGGSTTMRNTPDVAANADNIYLYADDGQGQGGWGGTSAAAPLWAAFTALMNEQAAENGASPVGFLNPTLYSLATGSQYNSLFHDVTSGNNTWRESPSKFYATSGYDLCTGLGSMNGTAMIKAIVGAASSPTFQPHAAGYTLTTNEPCPNNAIYPGETVTVNLILENVGSVSSTNLVGTLLTANGVFSLSGPVNIGAVAAGAFSTNQFTFFNAGTCGETLDAIVHLQDGSANFGVVSYSLEVGLSEITTNYATNFDTVSPGTLPAGWSALASSGLTNWTTEVSTNDGTTNAAFCPDNASPGAAYLYSPTITLPAGAAQLSFLNNYNLEDTYDGGVLQIAIGTSAIQSYNYEDIVTAGGSFVTGGYTGVITDDMDPTSRESPLFGYQAWTGNSDGVVKTIVNLPSSASGTNIALRWFCGTDFGNANVSGTPGWWIDDITIGQAGFDCFSCVSNVTVPTLAFPTNGYRLTNYSPVVQVAGLAPANATLAIFTNSAMSATTVADNYGVYSAAVTLAFGSNTLSVAAGTNSSVTNNVYIALGPPVLNVPSVANPSVTITGLGAPGAVVSIFQGTNAVGSPLTTLNVDAAGNFSVAVTLPLGTDTLTATEAVSGQTSAGSTPVSVNVVTTLPPKIVSPADGIVTNRPSVTVTGTGAPGASVTIYDTTSSGASHVSATVKSNGKFSATVGLADGVNTLFANQSLDGTSPDSGAISITDYLLPQILTQPVNQTNFLKGSVTFSATVVGAAPLKLFWEKNGIKIPGATSASLTLSDLNTNVTTNRYSLTASNLYGTANSAIVSVSLVTNPFPNLAGNYYGLFAESNAQFDSSGFLSLSLSSSGKFSAKILSAGGSYPFSGAMSGVGYWSNNVSRGAGKTPLSVLLNLNVTNGDEEILGTVSEGTNWTADLQADRATFGKSNPFPASGKYTVVFAGTNNNGDGYATASINASGLVSMTGALSDNTTIAPGAVSISKFGQWPLYVPLYGKNGSLSGWIDFTNQSVSLANLTNTNPAPSMFSGSNVMWFRTNAFTNSLFVVGSTNSTADVAAFLASPSLEVFLSGGDLSGVLSNSVTPEANGKFIINGAGIPGLTLSLSPASGLIKGSFTDSASARAATIRGVVFPQQTNAAGFFLSGTNSGLFLLTPP